MKIKVHQLILVFCMLLVTHFQATATTTLKITNNGPTPLPLNPHADLNFLDKSNIIIQSNNQKILPRYKSFTIAVPWDEQHIQPFLKPTQTDESNLDDFTISTDSSGTLTLTCSALTCNLGMQPVSGSVYYPYLQKKEPSKDFPTDAWMREFQDYIADKPFATIAIPGTHDSATSTLTWTSKISPSEVPPILTKLGINLPIIARWAKAQPNNITDQLKAGIRYLDIRLVEDKGIFVVHLLEGESIDQVLNDIQKFINMPGHEQEIIIIDFNHFYNFSPHDHDTLTQKLINAFGSKLAPNTLSPQHTMADFWQNEYQVIVLYDENETVTNWNSTHPENPILWSSTNIVSYWPNAQTIDELEKYLVQKTLAERKNNPDKFFVLQGILTPDPKMIAKGFFGHTNSLKKLAAQVNPKVCSWLKDWEIKKEVNIVITDFFSGASSCLRNLIESNRG